jgi:hypothetical protein
VQLSECSPWLPVAAATSTLAYAPVPSLPLPRKVAVLFRVALRPTVSAPLAVRSAPCTWLVMVCSWL